VDSTNAYVSTLIIMEAHTDPKFVN